MRKSFIGGRTENYKQFEMNFVKAKSSRNFLRRDVLTCLEAFGSAYQYQEIMIEHIPKYYSLVHASSFPPDQSPSFAMLRMQKLCCKRKTTSELHTGDGRGGRGQSSLISKLCNLSNQFMKCSRRLIKASLAEEKDVSVEIALLL